METWVPSALPQWFVLAKSRNILSYCDYSRPWYEVDWLSRKCIIWPNDADPKRNQEDAKHQLTWPLKDAIKSRAIFDTVCGSTNGWKCMSFLIILKPSESVERISAARDGPEGVQRHGRGNCFFLVKAVARFPHGKDSTFPHTIHNDNAIE